MIRRFMIPVVLLINHSNTVSHKIHTDYKEDIISSISLIRLRNMATDFAQDAKQTTFDLV